jgi:hypothetical protein
MGANKTYQQKGDRGRLLGESDEFKRLRRAVEKRIRQQFIQGSAREAAPSRLHLSLDQ